MQPKLTIYFDYERSYLSVAHLVRSERNPDGAVLRIPCAHFKAANAALSQLRRGTLAGLTKDDYKNIGAVVHDTVSRMATLSRRALIAEPAVGVDYWVMRDSLQAEQSHWGRMSDLIGRLFADNAAWCEDNGVPLILLCHERVIEDDTTHQKQGGLDLNAALRGEVVDNSDFVWRAWCEERQVKTTEATYPPGTYFLKMAPSEQKATKKRLPPGIAKLPAAMPDPTLQKAFDVLTPPFQPNIVTIYGPSGAGKTTIATSLSDPKNYKEGK